MDISNKFLVFLLVVAILVTIVGTWYSIDRISRFASLTGYQVTEGNVTVNVTAKAEINVTQTVCDFGTGYVTAPYGYAILRPGGSGCPSDGTTAICACTTDVKDNWTNSTTYNPECMLVRNDGNRGVEVNVSSGKDVYGFLGGSGGEYKIWSEEKENLACTGGEIALPNRTEMDQSNITICNELYPNNSSDELYVGCYLKVPDNTFGYKEDTWTFTGTAV